MIDEREAKSRRFLGELFPSGSRREINIQHKALKAYLRGDKLFRYGIDMNKQPMWYKTPQQILMVDD